MDGTFRRFAELLDAAPDAMVCVERGGRIVLVNAQAEILFGYGRAELVGRPVGAVVPEAAGGVQAQYQAGPPADAGPRPRMEVAGRRRDGSGFPADISLSIIDIGSESLVILAVRDMTGRPAVPGQLDRLERSDLPSASKGQLRAFWEHLPQLVWTCTPEGKCDYLSRRWVEYTGIPEHDQLGYAWSQQLHPDDWPGVEQAWLTAVDSGRFFDVEFRIRRHDGVYRWFATRAIPMRDEEGQVVGWVGSNTDVEDFKRSEDLKRSEENLKRSNEELEMFAYSIAHDLRTPLRALDGYSKVLLHNCAEKLGEKDRWYLERLRAGAVRLGNLVDDLLQLSRISRKAFNRTTIDLTELASEIVAELTAEYPDRAVDARVQEGLSAETDPRLARTILQNLLGNAFKFTSKTARPRIGFGMVDQNGTPVYFVSDNGAGFDMAHTSELFLPFRRLHRDSEFPGDGIGLATVVRAVGKHGGRIWAEGAVDAGATFHFTLRPGATPPASAACGEDVLPAWRLASEEDAT